MKITNLSPIFLIILVAILSVVGFFYLNSRIEISRHPTQDEWLEVYVSHIIHKKTDVWQQRLAISAVIFSQNADGKPLVPKEMIITITSPNGQQPVTDNKTRGAYIESAKGIAESILENYGVAKEYKLTVQFID